MVYIIGWGVIYFGLLVQYVARYRGRFFLFLSLTVLAIIAFWRGDVGTDTVAYELMFAEFLNQYRWEGREPGFVLLGMFLSAIAPSVELAVRFISLVFFCLLVMYTVRATRNERFVLLAYFLPAFAYQYSMNALRIGLASAVLLLAIQSHSRGERGPYFANSVAAILFHYTAAFSLLYLFISDRRWVSLSSLFLVLLMLVGAAGVFVLARDYFLGKVVAYHVMESPSALSGLRIVVPLLLISIGVMLGRLTLLDRIKLFVLGVGATGAAWGLAQVSYAGLRVLDLIAFAFPLAVLLAYDRASQSMESASKMAFVLAGLAFAVGTYRGFSLEEGQGLSPFLPYTVGTFW